MTPSRPRSKRPRNPPTPTGSAAASSARGYSPLPTCSARIDGFQSARRGTKILVKGPEGLWKSPDEALGEQIEGTPPDVAAKVTTLREAEPPHEMLTLLLAETKSGKMLDAPGSYYFVYDPGRVRAYLRKELDKAIERKTVAKPDEIVWDGVEGRLWVHLVKPGGAVLRFSEERSVPIRYRRPGEPDDRRRYRTQMQFDLSAHGTATVDLPPEVRKKLGLE